MNLVVPTPFLEVKDLHVDIDLANGTLHALRGVSFSLDPGEALGIVGESGSGKTLTALALARLLPSRAKFRTDKIVMAGQDLATVSDRKFAQNYCSDRISIIFQDPMSSFNPVYTIGRQLTETMLRRGEATPAEARRRALMLLERVNIPDPESRLNQYPHQLSGGQRQRVMIAIALMNSPDLIIADEPTTALDVTVQAEILRLLNDLRSEFGMSLILITHDLGVVSRIVDKIAVMYAGEIIETGSCDTVLNSPQHPYTKGLLACVPVLHDNDTQLGAIPGIVPSLIGEIVGCSFANRCTFVTDQCRSDAPPIQTLSSDHLYQCVLPPRRQLINSSAIPIPTHKKTPAETKKSQDQDLPAITAQDVSLAFNIKRNIFSVTSKTTGC